MKKVTFLALISTILFLASCAVYQDNNLKSLTNLNQQEKQFLAKFEDAVVKHKRKVLTTYLDENYRQEELVKLYGNNKIRFWNEMFCGYLVDNSDKFACIKLRNIREIHLIKVSPGFSPNEKKILFKVIGHDKQIYVELILSKHVDIFGDAHYGIIGAYG